MRNLRFVVKVSNVSWTVSPKEFRAFARQQGKVLDAFLQYDRLTGLTKGSGIITFVDGSVGKRLVRSNQYLSLGGQNLRFTRLGESPIRVEDQE